MAQKVDKIKHLLVSSQNLRYRVLLIISGLALLIMFTSRIWMPVQATEGLDTPIDGTVTCEQKEFTLRRWVYSESQASMEVEIDISNKAFDGVNEYEFSSVTKEGEPMPVEVIVCDTSMTVVEIKNVPAKFTNVLLRVRPAGSETYAKLFTSFSAVERVDNIEPQSLEQYYIKRNMRQLDRYATDIESAKADIETLESKIYNARLAIADIDVRLPMQTPEDAKTSTRLRDEYEKNITDWQKQIKDDEKEIDRLNGLIAQVQETIGTLRGEENNG